MSKSVHNEIRDEATFAQRVSLGLVRFRKTREYTRDGICVPLIRAKTLGASRVSRCMFGVESDGIL